GRPEVQHAGPESRRALGRGRYDGGRRWHSDLGRAERQVGAEPARRAPLRLVQSGRPMVGGRRPERLSSLEARLLGARPGNPTGAERDLAREYWLWPGRPAAGDRILSPGGAPARRR